MHQLQSYKQEPIYDGNAYTITSTYHAGNLNMYTTHITSSGPGGSPEYHMSQVGGWNTIGDPDTCRRGFTAFRNARDRAQEQRDAFVLAANERARSVNIEPPPFESFDHNDGSDPTGVQDVSHLMQAEDLVDDPRYYMSQQYVQEGYDNEPPNFASDFNGFTDSVQVQGAANEGAGYIYTDPSTFESSDYSGPSETTDTSPLRSLRPHLMNSLSTHTRHPQPPTNDGIGRRGRPSPKLYGIVMTNLGGGVA